MFEEILQALSMASYLEMVSVFFGLIYVVLAAKENLWCWPAAFISTGTAIFLFWDASLLMESALNVFYLLITFYGFYQWQFGGNSKTQTVSTNQGMKPLTVSSRGWRWHLTVISCVLVLSSMTGYFLADFSTAALPFIDSFTTWSAVAATWMVARKVLENWLYWIVIDLVSVWLYLERDLVLYAILYALYTILAVYGYSKWRAKIT